MSEEENKTMELLSAYIDGELGPAEKERVRSFLSSSAEGRKVVEKLTRTKTLLMSSPVVKVPVDFLDALEAQAQQAQEKAGPSFWRRSNPWAWASSFATASLVLAAGIGLYTPRQIPMETLIAAHMSMRTGSSLHQRVLRAAHYRPPMRKKNAAV